MVWTPTVLNEVLHVACPLLSAWVAHPAMALPPSKNATEPVGVPVPGGTGATVAVMVTGCPVCGEAGDTDAVVVVL